MAAIIIPPKSLCDGLSETVGYKSGLALSIKDMCNLLKGTEYVALIKESETHQVRVRFEEYEDLFYELLYRVGYTEEKIQGGIIGASLYHKYKGTDLEETLSGVMGLLTEAFPKMVDAAESEGKNLLDPSMFMEAAAKKFGKKGLDIAMEKLELIDREQHLSPISGLRYTEWNKIQTLDSLFQGGPCDPEVGKFIDQRFLNYLYFNHDKLKDIYWRKFEELTAEYFDREGYNVQLGPGSNDDGVDVRVWKRDQTPDEEPPHLIIQCKRQKKKVEKIVVKGLYADMQFQNAKQGLIVTSSELSPGARSTIAIRGYAIKEVNKKSLQKWLEILHVPGTGIVRL